MIRKFPHYSQLDATDCGPTCLRMIAKYYGRNYSLETLRERSFISREGVSMLGMSDAATSIGFRTAGIMITPSKLVKEQPLPCILHWNQNHFVVCYKIRKRKKVFNFYIADPASQRVVYSEKELERCWISTKTENKEKGLALLLQPSPEFYNREGETGANKKQNFLFFARYLIPYKKEIVQLILGMITVSLLLLIMPFLTQAIVDKGIKNHNLNFITLILISQLIIFIAKLSIDFIRSWILLHVNVRINIALISDFLFKLMKMPLHFFDTKMIGDLIQRIKDHDRIKNFLTGSSINILFSFVNIIILGIVLAYYNLTILGIFFLGNLLYIIWVQSFMSIRKKLDIKRFNQSAKEQSNLFQLINGMQEIKLNNCETQKRWQWERIQVNLFNIGIKSLSIGQYQQLGSVFFSQTTNIIISFIAAREVVMGNMTLGMMMSLTYIIGQLSSPIEQIIAFSRNLQDAKISLERLSEIHEKEDEEELITQKVASLPANRSLIIENMSFSYNGADRNLVLDNVNLTIPQNKVTAIVGASGSGKTTLIKLLLGFYEPNKGRIKVGDTLLANINPHLWRSKSGCVMQDGFIFSESIARNIAIGEEVIDEEKLHHAAIMANICDFIESLPLNYNTIIGSEGSGISQGQKQRILIARVIYKNPEYIFLDEATNALDANNEKEIMKHLQTFYKGRTVVIVAHRLSTVKNADNIIVLDKGCIVEEGTHEQLTKQQGEYYKLVKNQLELGE